MRFLVLHNSIPSKCHGFDVSMTSYWDDLIRGIADSPARIYMTIGFCPVFIFFYPHNSSPFFLLLPFLILLVTSNTTNTNPIFPSQQYNHHDPHQQMCSLLHESSPKGCFGHIGERLQGMHWDYPMWNLHHFWRRATNIWEPTTNINQPMFLTLLLPTQREKSISLLITHILHQTSLY